MLSWVEHEKKFYNMGAEKENCLFLACKQKHVFFLFCFCFCCCCFFFSLLYLRIISIITWFCQKVCADLSFLLDNSLIRFGMELHQQTVGIPTVLSVLTTHPSLHTLHCRCVSLLVPVRHYGVPSHKKSSWCYWSMKLIKPRYLDDLLNMDSDYFD